MALSSAIVWEVRTGGADTNGGGFKAGASGTDWSQQTAAQYSVTDGVTAGTTTITSATANFGTDVVGNVIYVQGGTGSVTAGWYEITARTNATTITVDRSTGLTAGTGVTLKIGGCLASVGAVGAVAVSSNIVWVKSGSYSITSASSNVAGGCPSFTTSVSVRGYQTTRGDYGTGPTLTASGISTFTMVTLTFQTQFINFTLDGASLTSSRGVSNATQSTCSLVYAANFTNSAFIGNGRLWRCRATGCATQTAIKCGGIVVESESYGNTIGGFDNNGANVAQFIRCIASGNTGASSDGFSLTGGAAIGFYNCVAYGNGRDGIRLSTISANLLENCLLEGNGGYGVSIASANNILSNCGTYNNTSGGVQSVSDTVTFNAITGSATFFTNAGSGDFSLNTTAGGGAAARAAGYPGVFPRGTTTGYLDAGAAQHADPASLSVNIFASPVVRVVEPS